ncbi:MAG: DinB family protein, partial [Chloroflexota bacterium]
MNIETVKMLYDYTYYARDLLWDCVTDLSEEQYRQPQTYSVGSVHQQVVHMVSAEYIWFSRLNGTSPGRMFDSSDFSTREDVRDRWREVEQSVRTYLDKLTDDALNETFSYKHTSGKPYTQPIIHPLLHVVNHATDHRSQIFAIIHQMGGRTVEHDLIFYLRSLQTP